MNLFLHDFTGKSINGLRRVSPIAVFLQYLYFFSVTERLFEPKKAIDLSNLNSSDIIAAFKLLL
jgi:hypothetical protein